MQGCIRIIFEVLKAVSIKNYGLLGCMLCSSVTRHQYFGETCCLHLHGMGGIFPLGLLFALKEAARPFGSSVPIIHARNIRFIFLQSLADEYCMFEINVNL